ncbi:MAG: lytic transglycosylase domain-containing protein [Myxococcota bacterium]|nr:lytic transglycosylase domain-containing protein [Myxococcota bacterium]
MVRSLLIAMTWMGLVAPTATSSNDIYKCHEKDGQETLTNTPSQYRAQGARCRLFMKGLPTPSKPAAKADDQDSPKTRKKRNGYKPRAKEAVPRAVEEPTSAQDRYALYAPYAREAAEKYKLPESFNSAVMRVESSFHYQAVSSAGARGLMQLMPKTARSMGVHDSFDPRQNIMGGAKLLRVLANRFEGDFVKVLSAYHAGSGAVKAKGGIPYEATEGYVRAVMDHYYRYKAEEAS